MNTKSVAGGIGSVLVAILAVAAVVGKAALRRSYRTANRNNPQQTRQFDNSGGRMQGLSKEETLLLKRMQDVKKAVLSSPEREKPWLTRRTNFKTKLTRQVKSPQDWEDETLPKGLQLATYPSGNLHLKAILYVPPNLGNAKRPALVYYHGGFALSYEELEDCEPFVNDGFIIMLPMLRAENGGEGNFEFFGGELDDAANAIRWLGKHKNVDADNIYAFGHSIGGGISAMMSLMDDDLPLKHSGSSGGLYDPGTFFGWRYAFEDGPDRVPFDPEDVNECLIRTLYGNVKWMKRKHYAYIGTQDTSFLSSIGEIQQENVFAPDHTRLVISLMSGDHFTSLAPAVKQYHTVVMNGLKTNNTNTASGTTAAETSPVSQLPKIVPAF
ncbi:MAG: alpha/beta hydrolase fold domain-containing protein [Planctomycetaceae bacterium]|nr:alpha/beta hydrolase fold domain-containing protein [Planctomycetaceae bacterium]